MNTETIERPVMTDVAPEARSSQIAVRLVPTNDSDRPVLANYVSLQPASGMLLLDFGFLEPSVLAALPNVARRGGKLPESLNGRAQSGWRWATTARCSCRTSLRG